MAASHCSEITVLVPINIALVKYWGKRDENLILPLNDSLSLTVDGLYAETNVKVYEAPEVAPRGDVVTVNGDALDLTTKPRYAKLFDEFRRILKTKKGYGGTHKFVVSSETNFPVGAGLASSAAGYAAIAYALGRLYQCNLDEICRTARLGSGSACRSIYGGLVQWKAGVADDGSDSTCAVLAPADHWPSLTAVVVVISTETKPYASTDGMRRSTATSALLKYRVQYSVPEHLAAIKSAYLEQDFTKFAQYVMRDSNQLHAICMDTYPPLMYLSDGSKKMINFIHAYNEAAVAAAPPGGVGSLTVAYTFDAGANCCLFLEKKNLNAFLSCLCHYFPNDNEDKFIRGQGHVHGTATNRISISGLRPKPNTVEYIVVSSVGGGPRLVE